MLDARTGCQDPVEVGETTRRLDDRDQIDCPGRQLLFTFQLRQQPIDRGERGSPFDLWQDDPVEARTHDRNQVAVAELGVGGIDPNIEERSPRQCQHRGHGLRAAGFSAVATASPRSRMTASALSDNALATRRAWFPGANRKLRNG
jgi:hypothetical protein